MYNQKNTPPDDDRNQLCWAASTAMVASYYLGDNIDRTYNIAEFYAEPDYTNFNSAKRRPALKELGLGIDINETLHNEDNPITSGKIKESIDSQKPVTLLYYGSDSGHAVVCVGYIASPGHETLLIVNDPWDGTQKILSCHEAKKYPDGRLWTQSIN